MLVAYLLLCHAPRSEQRLVERFAAGLVIQGNFGSERPGATFEATTEGILKIQPAHILKLAKLALSLWKRLPKRKHGGTALYMMGVHNIRIMAFGEWSWPMECTRWTVKCH